MKDLFSLTIFCALVFVVFGKVKDITKSNVTKSGQLPSPGVYDNKVPDFHVFDWRLCKGLHEVEKNNAVISSISVKLVLLMLLEGALGDTAKQIRHAVGFSNHIQNTRDQYSLKLQSLQNHGKDDYDLDIGTKLFINTVVEPKQEFLQTITKWYNSSYEVVDFSKPVNAVNSINKWAENITHGHIQHLITDAETKENTLLLLLNAVYFKGYWTHPFNKDLTKNGSFYLNSKTVVDVSFMTTYDLFKISTLKSLKAQLISLPYEGNKFVMYIILPDAKDGLDDLINNINPALLSESIANMVLTNTKVVLPKFNFESTSILGPILQKLGITDMFGIKANLKNIGNGPLGSLFVSNVLQKAGLEVNEQGSTAHAATEVDLDHRFGSSTDAVFEVNKPFLFMIQDITMDTIVFVGKVVNPLLQGAPVVSIPMVNPSSTTPIKPVLENVELKMNQRSDVNFERFIYFDSELFKELSLSQLDSNFVASSASVKSILSLLSEVAQGETLNELTSVLRLPNDQSTLHNLLQMNKLTMSSSIIDIVDINNIFVKNKNIVSNSFKDIANDLYSVNITEINFSNIDASVKMINDKIASDTNGVINNIISKDDFDRSTELLLANALYFKGDWLVKFNKSNTKSLSFFNKPGVSEIVSMMYLEDKIRYNYNTDINSQVIELFYKDTNFSMIIILPDENITFTQLLKDMQHNSLSKITSLLHHRTVNLFLPRFKINYSTKLTTILKKMGLTTLFDSSANLSSIFSPEKQVCIKDITHKVTIDVDETGSKASALTVANVMTLSSAPKVSLPPVIVNVNRPFVFFIINRATKNALFSGQVFSINPANVVQTNLRSQIDQSDQGDQKVNFVEIPQKSFQQEQILPKYQQPQSKNQKSIN